MERGNFVHESRAGTKEPQKLKAGSKAWQQVQATVEIGKSVSGFGRGRGRRTRPEEAPMV
jgi:hypothetical protein